MDILTVNQFILTVFGFMQRINITKFCKNSQERVLQMHFTTLTVRKLQANTHDSRKSIFMQN